MTLALLWALWARQVKGPPSPRAAGPSRRVPLVKTKARSSCRAGSSPGVSLGRGQSIKGGTHRGSRWGLGGVPGRVSHHSTVGAGAPKARQCRNAVWFSTTAYGVSSGVRIFTGSSGGGGRGPGK